MSILIIALVFGFVYLFSARWQPIRRGFIMVSQAN